jgi:hypothetical protein
MKTILFFDRCELTDLYASISLRMKEEFNIIHVAYSLYEKKNLEEKYGITADYVFQELVKVHLNNGIRKETIEEIDSLIIQQSNGRFNLNSSMQSDRGFSLLNYEESLLLIQSQYTVWNKIFSSNKIDFFYHEPPSLFMNHIASFLCLSYGARYCYDSMIKGEDRHNYILLMQDTAFSPEINRKMSVITKEDITNNKERIEKFLTEFRESYNVFFGDKIKTKINYFYLVKQSFKFFVNSKIRKYKFDRIKDNIDYYLLQQNNYWIKFKNIINYKLNVKFDDLDISHDYYYYSMNLEPEATVLYLGDGIYENQIKLILNIASQLPPCTYLYVKDHPHFVGYRNYMDYVKLMRVSNVKILKTEVPGKQVIKDCIGVFIVNGTAGFEAILLNKQVYTFGHMFFNVCERVNYIKNVKDLREVLYRNQGIIYEDNDELYKFILAFLSSTYEGVTDFFQGRMSLYDVDYDKNIECIAKDLSVFFNRYPYENS